MKRDDPKAPDAADAMTPCPSRTTWCRSRSSRDFLICVSRGSFWAFSTADSARVRESTASSPC